MFCGWTSGWGEIILSKAAGAALVFWFAWTGRGGPAGIGFHSGRLWYKRRCPATWHLVWPLKHLMSGQSNLPIAGIEALNLLVATLIADVTYGYLFNATGSLWTPWMAHLLNNSVYNFLHIRAVGVLDPGLMVVQSIARGGLLLLMPAVGWVSWVLGMRP